MKYPDTWTFKNKKIAQGFSSHVHEQLPWYNLVSDHVLASVAQHYVPVKGVVYDIGCSTGNATMRLEKMLIDRQAEVVSIDDSQDMVDAFMGCGECVCADAVAFDYKNFDFCILFLSAMFIAPHKRALLLSNLQNKLNDGGAIFLVERFLPDGGYNSLISARMTLQAKLTAGCSSEDIISKELSLRGIQRPLNRGEVDGYEIFRFGDFSAYILTK